MSNARRRHGALALAGMLLASLFANRPGVHTNVHAQAGCEATVISAPLDGDILAGSIEILGSATIPDFNFYKVEWATQADPENWIAVSEVVNAPVRNGRLDTWRTEGLPDGPYRLKLTVVDSTFGERCRFTLQSLRVANVSSVQPEAEGAREAIPTAPATAASASAEGDLEDAAVARADQSEPTATAEAEPADTEPSTDTSSNLEGGGEDDDATATLAPSEPEDEETVEQEPTIEADEAGEPEPTSVPRATMEPVLPRSSAGESGLPAGMGRNFVVGLGLALLAGLGLVVLLLRR